ncbi:MAG: formimidoylglutamase [Bacteroidales bacterium]|nr:formimidoylglutamase [Bacteroidales bacterium]
MDISIYFEPIIESDFQEINSDSKKIANFIKSYFKKNEFPHLEDIDIAIFGVKEDRNAVNNKGCALAPDIIRKKLYNLFHPDYNIKIADLGNINKGYNINDTYFAVTDVITNLLKKNIIPVIIGGSQDITFANYKAYEKLKKTVNIIAVDSCLDIDENNNELSSKSYLNKIILQKPNYLFNYTNIGYQTYFTNPYTVKLMNNLLFDIYRLGHIRENIKETEPLVRNADILSFDISSVRQSDAPGNSNASPNGFYGEEICQIIRYAGLSNKLSSIGFYEYNPEFDNKNQTAHLIAQMIWYFIDGFYNRKHDFPDKDNDDNFVKYIVTVNNDDYRIIFLKSKTTNRWWIDLRGNKKIKPKYKQHYIIPCSHKDYQTACDGELPDRWWKAYQKLM